MLDDVPFQLADGADLRSVCEALLQRSLRVTDASFGNVQLVDWRAGELHIVAQRGFQPDFLRFFARVKYRDTCACARVLASRVPIVIPDVMSEPTFAPYRQAADRAGFRAVQSTPLLSSSSAFVGVVSTHFTAAHAPAVQELESVKEAACLAADAIIALRTRSLSLDALIERSRVAVNRFKALLDRLGAH